MEDAIAVANFFVNKSFNEGNPITPMQLVKLVYISHGWYLGLANEPLLSERVEAWKYGPVVPSVYYAFRNYGGSDVTQLVAVPDVANQLGYPTVRNPITTALLNKVWEVYKGYDGLALSAMTHQDDTPWYNAWHRDGGKNVLNKVIPNDDIKKHYKELIAKNLARNAT